VQDAISELDLSSTLAPYPPDFRRISTYPGSDLGEHLRFIGRIFRPFNPKVPDYYDDLVDEFINSVGETPSRYNRYVVVPKSLDLAKSSLMRYNRCDDPFSEKIKNLYNIAGEWLEKEFGP
jgi:hypothetical protein